MTIIIILIFGYEFWFREFFPVLSKFKSKYGFVSNINEGHHTNSQTLHGGGGYISGWVSPVFFKFYCTSGIER